MSAFPESGRSVGSNINEMTVRLRPQAVVEIGYGFDHLTRISHLVEASLGFEPKLEQLGILRRWKRGGEHTPRKCSDRVIDARPNDLVRVDQIHRVGVAVPVPVLVEQRRVRKRGSQTQCPYYRHRENGACRKQCVTEIQSAITAKALALTRRRLCPQPQARAMRGLLLAASECLSHCPAELKPS